MIGGCALILAALAIAGQRDGESQASSPDPDQFGAGIGTRELLQAETLHPEFTANRRHYVMRCDADAAELLVNAGPDIDVRVNESGPLSGSFSATICIAPGHDFDVSARSGDTTSRYEVRCLPEGFPEWSFEPRKSVSPGLFATTVGGGDQDPWVIVFDSSGTPRWWYEPQTIPLGAQILSDGTVSWSRSFGDGYGQDPRMAHEVHSLSGETLRTITTVGSVTDAHEFTELPSGNVLVNSYRPRPDIDFSEYVLPGQQGPSDAAAAEAEVQEIERDGTVAWRWNSHGRIGLAETPVRWRDSIVANPQEGSLGATYDPVHLNSVEAWGTDRIIVSTRHTDAVYGIDRETGDFVFKLGGVRTAESLTVLDDPAGDLTFGGQHDARIDSDDNLSVFDNAKDRPHDPRVVRFHLDLEAGTATFLEQLRDPRIAESHCCGSARETGDGGWLVAWGDQQLITRFDEEGEIAFRLTLPTPSFRAVPVPEDAVSSKDLERGLEEMERR